MKQIQIVFDSNTTLSYSAGVKAFEVMGRLGPFEYPLVAVLVDNELQSLNTALESDCRLRPVMTNTALGAGVYRRSLCFLLAIASR